MNIKPIPFTLHRKKTAGGLVLLFFFLWYSFEFLTGISRQDAFTWMDPYQYYGFAHDFIAGIRAFNQFELPSIFPFFIVPFLKASPAIPSALCASLFFAAMLLAAGYLLCAQLNAGKRFGIVAVSFLCSPLVIGLSRSLYVELALSSIVAWQYVLWLKSDHFSHPRTNGLFVLLFGVGIMTKSTYPVFFIGPFIVEMVRLIDKKNVSGLLQLAALFTGPVIAVLLLQRLVFPDSFEYFRTGFYTNLPIMGLIGPSKVSVTASLGYYFMNIWKTMLFLLTPFLVLPLLPQLRRKGDLHLWMWFLGSLAVLTIPQVREPRHVAPALLPALLLIVLGSSRVKKPAVRTVLMSSVVLLSLLQYFLVTRQLRSTPYFIDRPSFRHELTETMMAFDPERETYRNPDGTIDVNRWKFSRNFVVTGYDPPMALALAWHLSPGVTYGADRLAHPIAQPCRFGFDHFEDLFFLESFNSYNRQCRWESNYVTLDYEPVIDNADFIIAGEASPEDLSTAYPRFRTIRRWSTKKGTVRLLQASSPSRTSYRSLYARTYLAKGVVNPETFSAIYLDLILNAALRQDSAEIRNLQKELKPREDRMVKPKNIYWTKDRAALLAKMDAYLGRHAR